MAAILAFVAVRLLQLGELVDLGVEVPVDQVLRPVEWKVLWVAIEKNPPPAQKPSSRWALVALGRLAGWSDTKRTGRVGWKTLWEGWTKLQQRVEGYEAATLLRGVSGT